MKWNDLGGKKRMVRVKQVEAIVNVRMDGECLFLTVNAIRGLMDYELARQKQMRLDSVCKFVHALVCSVCNYVRARVVCMSSTQNCMYIPAATVDLDRDHYPRHYHQNCSHLDQDFQRSRQMCLMEESRWWPFQKLQSEHRVLLCETCFAYMKTQKRKLSLLKTK